MDVTAWLVNSVTVAAYTGQDSTGAPSYAAQVAMPARIELKQKLVRAKDGSEVVSSHMVYVQSQIGILDQIFLPGDNTSDPTVGKYPIQVDAAYDRTGAVVYWKCTL